jgi:hypothetical protein
MHAEHSLRGDELSHVEQDRVAEQTLARNGYIDTVWSALSGADFSIMSANI